MLRQRLSSNEAQSRKLYVFHNFLLDDVRHDNGTSPGHIRDNLVEGISEIVFESDFLSRVTYE